jgi:hypothetical protein
MKRLPPALVLFFLAPAIGELLSGSAPPAEFFHPFTLLLLGALYGSGAILTREFAMRWGKGWPSMLLLGAAYGIVEEGLMVKSFFDPAWPDLGMLGVYGRWAGVNWVWSVFLTLYHAVFSIAIPIFLVEQMYPARGGESWVSRRGFRGLAIMLTLDVIFGFALLTSYRPSAVPYLAACAAAAALFWMARRAPADWPDGAGEPKKNDHGWPLWISRHNHLLLDELDAARDWRPGGDHTIARSGMGCFDLYACAARFRIWSVDGRRPSGACERRADLLHPAGAAFRVGRNPTG